MSENQDNLKYVYQKMTALEVVDKLSNPNIVWLQIDSSKFECTIQQGLDVWDIVLTQNLSGITLDFTQNGDYFYTLYSSDEPSIFSLFNGLSGDEDFRKDLDLLRDVMQFEGCE